MQNPEALIAHGYEARRTGNPELAKRHFSEALERCDGSVPGVRARALTALGQVERDLKQTESAIAHYEQAAEIYRANSDALRLAHTIRHVADILRGSARQAEALPLYEEAMQIYRAHPASPPLDVANALRGFALLKDDLGDREDGRSLWLEARKLYAAVQVQAGVEECESRLKF